MPKITITLDLADELADPELEMGVTNDCYDMLVDALAPFGDDIDIKRGASDDN